MQPNPVPGEQPPESSHLDRPYYLLPADASSAEAFNLLRAGMESRKVAALARTILFRRLRTVLIRADGDGFIANTLKFDYEVRSEAKAFADNPNIEVADEMLELAEHIIDTKLGHFDPSTFDDRYDAALAELVKAKLEGRPPPRLEVAEPKVVDLMTALRESVNLPGGKKAGARKSAGKTQRRKAG